MTRCQLRGKSMPTKQFFNLAEEKRNILLRATIDELNRVPINDFSINQVVKNAGIARGSFYIYFENVQDIIEYVMKEYKNKLSENMLKTLKKNNGDIFETYKEIFIWIIDFIGSEENTNMKQNIMYCLVNNLNNSNVNKCREEQQIFITELNENIDKELLNISDSKEIYLVLDILNSISKNSIEEIVILKEDKNNIVKRYIDKIELVKKGLKVRGGINE
ncbi:MAG: TetR/AcrR family transcriptional regulator [Clostridiales bacterium]|nr:TetR/AcrR family transcriptional regulator [Clostridiales bacterium]